MKTFPFQQVSQIGTGYLITPMNQHRLQLFTDWDQVHDDHIWVWPEYALWDTDVYPQFLEDLAKEGVAFGWEYMCTEDFSYFAYNFPTQESRNNLICYNSFGRKRLPKLTKKLRLQYETESSINELLLTLGINPNGTT